ncbi:hypothetical protein LCGC14_2295590 [marine sediment metagenome]|uniref:Uncharacterized protein n=1 Tax=marine sediment metagenome TaxID=412755 RepID=A0A0F9FK33_9ZZZZ
MRIEFRVVGIPQRHRVGARAIQGKHGRPIALIYDDPKAKDWKRTVQAAALLVRPDRLLTGPVELTAVFYMPILKSFSKKKVAAVHAGEEIPHVVTPDRTALLRSTEDALTGVIWVDDAQVWNGPLKKIYGDPPGVEIVIETPEDSSNG